MLRLFDPAFAATDIPALLAPVKATYHNALAHPFWLYHPDEAAERFSVESTVGARRASRSGHDANFLRCARMCSPARPSSSGRPC